MAGRDVVLNVHDLFRAIGGSTGGADAAQVSCNQSGDYLFARLEENKWDAGDSFPPSDGWLGGTLSSTSLIFLACNRAYGITVQRRLTAHRRSSIGRIAAVSVMLGLLLGISALAVSPHLHHLLHQDSKSANHNCLAAQLNKAPLVAGYANVSIVAPTSVFPGSAGFVEFRYFPASDYRLSPSRAPPSSPS